MLNNYVYKEDIIDDEDKGLMIPRYKALGRTAPDGKVYSDKPLANPNEADLVPVRSIVTKTKGDLNVISPDMIGPRVRDFTDGAAIGLSFATSLTENITQGALGLKHGGHERVLNQEGYLKAPKACKFREEGKFIILKVRGGELKYPRPENLVVLDKTEFEKGESVCVAYNTTSPIYKLNAIINLMRAKGGVGQRYFEKDSVVVSDCYALSDGIIHYKETKEGEMEVRIGETLYDYNPLCMYYFPDGAEVKKFQRIASGVVNMNHVVSELGNNINDIYLIFRSQFYTLSDKGFLKNGYTDLAAPQEELVELLFTGLVGIDYDPKTEQIDEIRYQGTQTSVMNKKSFYTTLSYGYSSKVVSKALKGEVKLKGDVMTDTILGLLLNEQLDNKN